MNDEELLKEIQRQEERASWWEKTATEHRDEADYYREQLAKAHALLGRVTHQLSERWDSVNLTEHFPTDNPHRQCHVGNAKGDQKND